MSALIPSILRLRPALPPVPAPSPSPSLAPPPSPGTWRHPKFAEIVSRSNASTFSEQDFRRAAFSFIGLLLSFVFGLEVHATLQTLVQGLLRVSNWNLSTTTYITYAVVFLRLYLLLNLTLALVPFFPSLTNDTISDISLTPTQRALMGLSPSPSPSPAKRTSAATTAQVTPGSSTSSLITTSSPSSVYITPPRYKRTPFSHSPSPAGRGAGGSSLNTMGLSTPGSGRSTSAAYFSSSPISDRAAVNLSPFRSISNSIGKNRLTNSGFSPIPRSPSGSPLLQKALASSSYRNDESFSFSPSTPAGSGLRRSQSVREGVGERSPGAGNLSPALNYKWLYDKERRHSGLARGIGMGVLGGGRGGDGSLIRSESIPI